MCDHDYGDDQDCHCGMKAVVVGLDEGSLSDDSDEDAWYEAMMEASPGESNIEESDLKMLKKIACENNAGSGDSEDEWLEAMLEAAPDDTFQREKHLGVPNTDISNSNHTIISNDHCTRTSMSSRNRSSSCCVEDKKSGGENTGHARIPKHMDWESYHAQNGDSGTIRGEDDPVWEVLRKWAKCTKEGADNNNCKQSLSSIEDVEVITPSKERALIHILRDFLPVSIHVYGIVSSPKWEREKWRVFADNVDESFGCCVCMKPSTDVIEICAIGKVSACVDMIVQLLGSKPFASKPTVMFAGLHAELAHELFVNQRVLHTGYSFAHDEPCSMYMQLGPLSPSSSSLRSSLQMHQTDVINGIPVAGDNSDGGTAALPKGFVFDRVRGCDLDIIHTNWKFGSEHNRTYVEMLIKNFPSVCIRPVPSATTMAQPPPVCWILKNVDGSFGLLHTLSSHRGKGFASRLVMYASKELGSDISNFCYIEEDNDTSRKVFQRNGYVKVANISWVFFHDSATVPLSTVE
eukprot:m.53728 g.53728  ORF g.53728 m.53728 type:complete len:519 (-) comp7681_c0_seq1:1481-3037(-)